jgi:hypothetical protein
MANWRDGTSAARTPVQLEAACSNITHAAQHGPGGADELFAFTLGNRITTRHDWYPRDRITGTLTPTTGQLFLSYFTAYNAGPFTKLGWIVSAAGSGLTLVRLGLYTVAGNGDLTLVARTANDTTLGTTGGEVTRSLDTTGGFPASLSPVIGQRYAAANVSVGTPATVLGASLGNGTVGAIAPRINGLFAGQADLPTTIPSGSVAGTSSWIWGEIAA